MNVNVTVPLEEAGERASREVLAPLLDQLDGIVDLDDDRVEEAVRFALVRALMEGVRIGGEEAAAQMVLHGALQGLNIVPKLVIELGDPADD